MCRWDDGDYEWYVDGQHDHVVTGEPIRCEDCGRLAQPGETIVRLTAVPCEDDDRPWVHVIFLPASRGPRWYVHGSPLLAILDEEHFDTQEEFDLAVDAFDALGFGVDEIHDPRLPERTEPDHFWCGQCHAANEWLEQVCDQHVVLVAATDLEAHLCDYSEEQLGPDFVTMAVMASRRWRTKDHGNLVSVEVVERWARDAIAHAVATGLHPE